MSLQDLYAAIRAAWREVAIALIAARELPGTPVTIPGDRL
jgi:hypothetical protein